MVAVSNGSVTVIRRDAYTLDVQAGLVAISPSGSYIAYIGNEELTLCAVGPLERCVAVTSGAMIGISNPAALAVSDTGTIALADLSATSIVQKGSLPKQLAFGLAFPRFEPHSERIIGYSRDDAAVLALDVNSLTVERLITTESGLTDPTGIELYDSTVWVSQTGDQNLLAYSLTSHAISVHELAAAGAIRPLGAPGIYVWADYMLLDARSRKPQLLVIPTENE